jgi:hypothetical protein
MNAETSITGRIVFAITCPPTFEANSFTAPMMSHTLTDDEIGRPEVVEPCGIEGYPTGHGRRELLRYSLIGGQ